MEGLRFKLTTLLSQRPQRNLVLLLHRLEMLTTWLVSITQIVQLLAVLSSVHNSIYYQKSPFRGFFDLG
jgi:hypothetical protein